MISSAFCYNFQYLVEACCCGQIDISIPSPPFSTTFTTFTTYTTYKFYHQFTGKQSNTMSSSSNPLFCTSCSRKNLTIAEFDSKKNSQPLKTCRNCLEIKFTRKRQRNSTISLPPDEIKDNELDILPLECRKSTLSAPEDIQNVLEALTS